MRTCKYLCQWTYENRAWFVPASEASAIRTCAPYNLICDKIYCLCCTLDLVDDHRDSWFYAWATAMEEMHPQETMKYSNMFYNSCKLNWSVVRTLDVGGGLTSFQFPVQLAVSRQVEKQRKWTRKDDKFMKSFKSWNYYWWYEMYPLGICLCAPNRRQQQWRHADRQGGTDDNVKNSNFPREL